MCFCSNRISLGGIKKLGAHAEPSSKNSVAARRWANLDKNQNDAQTNPPKMCVHIAPATLARLLKEKTIPGTRVVWFTALSLYIYIYMGAADRRRDAKLTAASETSSRALGVAQCSNIEYT